MSSMMMSKSKKREERPLSTSTILLLLFSNAVSALIGCTFASTPAMNSDLQPHQLPNQACPPQKLPPKCPICPEPEEKERPVCPPPKECPATESPGLRNQQMQGQEQEVKISTTSGAQRTTDLFPEIVNRFAVGMAHTPQENFTKKFDLGVPIDLPKQIGDTGVLIIYNSEKSMPTRRQNTLTKNSELLSPEEATENCDYMNVVTTWHEGHRRQCLAIVPQYESFHIQKWMRVPEVGPGHGGHALRMVPRGYSMTGASAFHPPKHEKHTKKAWKMLETYLDALDDVIAELTPIVEKIAIDNTIVVMVCNFGQSQLLINFACSAKSKGIDISNVLVFATDEETKELAESVGLTAIFEKRVSIQP